MTDHVRRALLGALALSTIAGAASGLAPSTGDASASNDAPRLAYWQRLERLYQRAEARSEAASARCEATGERGEAYNEACRKAQLSRSLAESAAYIPARDWPSLSIKLGILRHSAGADQLSDDEAFSLLEADIRHVIAARSGAQLRSQ